MKQDKIGGDIKRPKNSSIREKKNEMGKKLAQSNALWSNHQEKGKKKNCAASD
jgi:hypothetical protein